MPSQLEVTVRCFQPEDSVRCHTMFTEVIRELCTAVMKKFFLDFLKVAAIFLVPVTAVAVKWSVWTLLVFYVVAFVGMTVAAYVYVYLSLMDFANSSLKSDLLDIEKYYDGHDSCMFVAECDGRVIGMVGVATKEYHKPGVAELQHMSVCPSARGKRIGTILLNKVIDYCKGNKYEKIILGTTTAHYAAVGLYRKHGFKLVTSKYYPAQLYLLFKLYGLSFERNIN